MSNFDQFPTRQRTPSLNQLKANEWLCMVYHQSQSCNRKFVLAKCADSSPVSSVMCHMSPVTFCLSPVTNANSQSDRPSPTMQSRLVCPDRTQFFFHLTTKKGSTRSVHFNKQMKKNNKYQVMHFNLKIFNCAFLT